MASIEITLIDERVPNPVPFILSTEYKTEFLIGRESSGYQPDIVVPDKYVSRDHAMLTADPTPGDGFDWYIQDLGSTWGTRVNDIRIEARNVALGEKGRLRGRPYKLSGYDDIILCGPHDVGFAISALTTSQNYEVPPIVLSESREDETVNRTIEEAIAKERERQANQKPWYAEFLGVVLNGPKGCPQWLWWMLLLMGSVFCFYVWAKYS